MEQMKIHFNLKESSPLPHTLADSGCRTHYSPASLTILYFPFKLPSPQYVLAASVYLTCNDGC